MIIDFHTNIFTEDVRQNLEKYIRMDPAFRLLYSDEKARTMEAKELIVKEIMDLGLFPKKILRKYWAECPRAA
jgi:hypothetical protein